MFNGEIDIFNIVKKSVLQTCPDCEVVSKFYTTAPTSFPALSVIEIENIPVARTEDSSNEEHCSEVTYQVDVYSNLTTGARKECKDIISVVSEVMGGLNATRTTLQSLSNEQDATITRMTARYVMQVDNNNFCYRR